ncbi:PAS domain-containing sensor histidine kinase [Neptuniibacter halophilus]|uniref:PAS domain-containing sensor histidine kinase n=1 Tax=Neptuniibacter halophilus TaxID=651666 RepID=UPI00257370E8|nr:PAS domain-containing sensor histidine kinase [Neptuniibacter halophilus]
MDSSERDPNAPHLSDDQEHNRLLAEMAEQSTDMISRHTPGDWRFIYASPAVEHLLGYRVDEIIGMSAYELYHPDDVEDFKRRAPSVSYERGTYTHSYRFRCKDGHYTWLESTSRSIRDPQTGELKEILVVSRDASRRINAEQTNRRLARVVENSSDLVVFFDLQQQVTDLNESARRLLGLDPGATPLSLSQLFSVNSYAQLQQGLPMAERSDQWHAEAEMQASSGQLIPVSLELLTHRDATGQAAYYSILARDLSARRAMEAERQRYQAEVSHASRLMTMGEMASGLAHELNQPLTAIVNYVRGLERRSVGKSELPVTLLEKPLHKIADTALRAGEIIRRMMDFTRKSLPQREAVALAPVLEDVLQFCATSAHSANVRLTSRIAESVPAVLADRIQLEQILLNLLLNAIEASASGENEAPGEVWIDALESTQGQVIIRVHDRGCGLPEGDSEQLFQQFYTTKQQGLGMGLAISRSLVEAHGGQLWAEPAEQGGAVFSFSLSRAESTDAENR